MAASTGDSILRSLRSLLLEHVAASQPLASDMAVGSTSINVPNTSKFRDGDDIFIMSLSGNEAEPNQVVRVNDWDELLVETPTLRGWTTAESAFVLKAVNHQPLKRIHIGDLRVIPDFPTITIDLTGESNEWITLRGTTHEYKFAIRAYVQYDNFEETNRGLIKLAENIREVLMDHIHPLVDGIQYPLLADVPKGAVIATIPDTSKFEPFRVVYLRDAKPHPSSQEDMVRSILSPTQLELATPAQHDYQVSRQAELILVNHYLYDSRPSDITYGFMPGQGGSLLKAAEITWFAKEERIRHGNVLT
jgi:hypothetical protein